MEDVMDDKVKQMLQDLGNAINESISGSEDVNNNIQRIRDEGYDLYVVLDATMGLDKHDEAESREGVDVPREVLAPAEQPNDDARFRIDVNDLSLLRGLGIDPTRKVRSVRKVQALADRGDG